MILVLATIWVLILVVSTAILTEPAKEPGKDLAPAAIQPAITAPASAASLKEPQSVGEGLGTTEFWMLFVLMTIFVGNLCGRCVVQHIYLLTSYKPLGIELGHRDDKFLGLMGTITAITALGGRGTGGVIAERFGIPGHLTLLILMQVSASERTTSRP